MDLISVLNMAQWKGLSPLDYPTQPTVPTAKEIARKDALAAAAAAVAGAAVAAAVDELPLLMQPFELGVPLTALGWTPLRKELGRLSSTKGKAWVRGAIASLVSGQFYLRRKMDFALMERIMGVCNNDQLFTVLRMGLAASASSSFFATVGGGK